MNTNRSKIKISACIITLNEEKNIARCINSLNEFVDEVIVVDSFSKDQTVSIAEGLGAKVIQRPFKGYGDQKLFAEQQASNEWLMTIDADEAASPELKNSILNLPEEPEYDAYTANILTNYCGTWIRHCGWYPQRKIRLWKKGKAGTKVDKVHEGIELTNEDSRLGHLKGDMFHYSYNTITDHIAKIQHYSEVGARFDVERGKKCSLLKLFIAPKLQFLGDYIFSRGFLDGYYGFIVCKNSSIASYVKYIKIRQYTALKKKGISY